MKLTDEKRKRIIADYIECENYSAVARKHGISPSTARNAVLSDKEVFEKLTQRKEENTIDVLKYMQSKKDVVIEIIDLYMQKLISPEHVDKATIQQIAGTLFTVIEKFTAMSPDGEVYEQGVIIMPEVRGDENDGGEADCR